MATTNRTETTKNLIIYTMTDGLGDYLVMGDLMRRAEVSIPDTKCVIIHRGNKNIHLWPYGLHSERFFSIYSVSQLARLSTLLLKSRTRGVKIFALQMAPGSVQGYMLHLFLKKIGLIDYIVDFNLINADIITPPESASRYILHQHLNQLEQLFNYPFPEIAPRLQLPINQACFTDRKTEEKPLFGIHPWTRRKSQYLIWQDKKWLEIIDYLIACGGIPVLFGRDSRFDSFTKTVSAAFGPEKVYFWPSTSVPTLINTVNSLSLLVSLNSSVIHVAYACNVPTVILSGPHLDIWTPIDKRFREVRDTSQLYPVSDERKHHGNIAMVARISVSDVRQAISELLICL